jgi:hypothetical protein
MTTMKTQTTTTTTTSLVQTETATILSYQSPYMQDYTKRDISVVSVVYGGKVYDIKKEIADKVPVLKTREGHWSSSIHRRREVNADNVLPHLTNEREGFWYNQGGWFSMEEDRSLLNDQSD